jgi:hypothetical protein
METIALSAATATTEAVLIVIAASSPQFVALLMRPRT